MQRNCKNCGKDFTLSEKYPQKIFCTLKCARDSGKRRVHRGEDHYNWGGDKIKYKSIHTWTRRTFGVPTKCEMCNSTGLKYEWASINHTYTRNRDDWKQVCTSCHRIMDGRSIPIYQLDGNFNVIAEYPSLSSAGKVFKRSNSIIMDAIINKQMINGFFFTKKSEHKTHSN